MTKRPGTVIDKRDVFADKHTPAAGVATGVPASESWDDGITGNHEGDELRRLRALRDESERLQRLEEKDDEHAKDIASIKLSVADIRGEQKATNVELRNINSTLERMARREDAKFTADVDVRKAKRIDTITAGVDKRRFWISIGTALIGGGAIGKLLHWLGVF